MVTSTEGYLSAFLKKQENMSERRLHGLSLGPTDTNPPQQQQPPYSNPPHHVFAGLLVRVGGQTDQMNPLALSSLPWSIPKLLNEEENSQGKFDAKNFWEVFYLVASSQTDKRGGPSIGLFCFPPFAARLGWLHPLALLSPRCCHVSSLDAAGLCPALSAEGRTLLSLLAKRSSLHRVSGSLYPPFFVRRTKWLVK